MKKTVFLFWLAFFVAAVLGGCRIIRIEEKEKTPLEYTVEKQEDIPKEAAVLIEKKKSREFQMTYQSEGELYLIKGYGQQMSGGYSISVEELALSGQTVFFKTELIGPSEASQNSEPSYPYIVVKMKYRKEPVQFLS